jgi:iron complex transport system substrate-binding protein
MQTDSGIKSTHRQSNFKLLSMLLLLLVSSILNLLVINQATAQVSVTDFAGNRVTLHQPAERIIALSPHAVENVFSAGAGDRLVGVVAYSNFPEAANQLPQVGSNNLLNYESILALNPDLIIAWQSGNTRSSLKRLRELGFTIYIDEPKTISDIAKSIRDIGALADTTTVASAVAKIYLNTLNGLTAKYQQESQVSVFYQVWNKPLQTLNGQHIVSQAIELCGGHNIFTDQTGLAPVINIEAIMQRDPQVIIASGDGNVRPAWLDEWLRWPQLGAVSNEHLYFVPPDLIQRHTVRLLDGAQLICQQLEQVRADN